MRNLQHRSLARSVVHTVRSPLRGCSGSVWCGPVHAAGGVPVLRFREPVIRTAVTISTRA
jgi:hypothetical protein